MLLSKIADEQLPEDDPAREYFAAQETGTVIRVTLPIDTPVEAPPVTIGLRSGTRSG
jgi:hypothetical protein